MEKIADYFSEGLQIVGDCNSIAHLAQFVKFDPKLCDGAIHSGAFYALLDEYKGFEMVSGNNDHYDGFFIEFNDGSKIVYNAERQHSLVY